MIGLPPRTAPLPDTARLAARQRLVLHLDRAVTRATLLAPAEGNTRFAGSVTVAADLPNYGVAVLRAHLSRQTGETVREPDVAIISRPPLRLLVLGTPGVEDEAALATITVLGIAQIVQRITPPRGAEREARWATESIERVARREADVLAVFVPPGPLAGWAARLLNAIHALPRHRQPAGLVRGLSPDLRDLLPTTAVFVPSGAAVDDAQAYTEALTQLAAAQTGLQPMPRAVLFRIPALVTALVAAERVIGAPLLYLDTADGTTLIFTEGGHARVYRDTAIDTGAGAATLLAQVDEEHIRRWLPFSMTTGALRGWASRRAAWPAATPLTPHDSILTAAFAREGMRALATRAGAAIEGCGFCVLGPGASAWGTSGQVLLTVMDAISFAGPVPIAQDADDLLPTIGWLARESPESAAALFTHDALTDLGTAVPVFGTGSAQETALRVALTAPPEEHATAVPWGALLRLPAPYGPADLYTHGRGDADFAAAAVRGGTGGVLIDARGRPLLAAPSRDEQHERMRRWLMMLDPRGMPR